MTGETSKSAGSRVKVWRESGSRVALVAGFGALLVLMAFICIDSLHTLGVFESENIQIRQDFLYREHTLDQVRASLYESANMVSDYFRVESDSHLQETLRADLQSIQTETTTALKSCIQSLPTGGREPFRHLAVEMEGYWSTIDPLFTVDAKVSEKSDNSALRNDAFQQRVEILKITKELNALNGDDLKEAERRIGEISTQFRRRFLMIVAIGLGVGLVLATATIRYAGRLENRLGEKYEETLRSQRELRELSKRLVDTEERERRAISRELHDEVGQSLSALLLDVQNLMEISGGEVVRQGLQNIKVAAENCLNEVRNMALLLRPSMLDDLGLVAALEWQAREVSKRTGMVVDMVEENVSDNLPEEHKTCIYRIVQEALNNCSKHAYAKNVRVVVRQEQNQLQVRIEDDGKGFDPRRMQGLGLVGMHERASRLGGVLKVDSVPARGTRLEVKLPLPNATSHR
jgi:signal transduction histidine kinase